MAEPSRIELSVKVKRSEGGREQVVFESVINIPIRSEKRSDIQPVVEQWLAMMDAALKVVSVEPAALEGRDG